MRRRLLFASAASGSVVFEHFVAEQVHLNQQHFEYFHRSTEQIQRKWSAVIADLNLVDDLDSKRYTDEVAVSSGSHATFPPQLLRTNNCLPKKKQPTATTQSSPRCPACSA